MLVEKGPVCGLLYTLSQYLTSSSVFNTIVENEGNWIATTHDSLRATVDMQ